MTKENKGSFYLLNNILISQNSYSLKRCGRRQNKLEKICRKTHAWYLNIGANNHTCECIYERFGQLLESGYKVYMKDQRQVAELENELRRGKKWEHILEGCKLMNIPCGVVVTNEFSSLPFRT